MFVGFGGNVGDVEENLRRALEAVAALPESRVRRVSSLYRTAPVGVTDQPDFVNGALEMETRFTPAVLLGELLRIEDELGRVRQQKWGPRTVDLDILLWNEQTLASPALVVPHPRMHERRFVLVPLAEIAPETRHPVLNRTIAALRDELAGASNVQLLSRPVWVDALEGDRT